MPSFEAVPRDAEEVIETPRLNLWDCRGNHVESKRFQKIDVTTKSLRENV